MLKQYMNLAEAIRKAFPGNAQRFLESMGPYERDPNSRKARVESMRNLLKLKIDLQDETLETLKDEGKHLLWMQENLAERESLAREMNEIRYSVGGTIGKSKGVQREGLAYWLGYKSAWYNVWETMMPKDARDKVCVLAQLSTLIRDCCEAWGL